MNFFENKTQALEFLKLNQEERWNAALRNTLTKEAAELIAANPAELDPDSGDFLATQEIEGFMLDQALEVYDRQAF